MALALALALALVLVPAPPQLDAPGRERGLATERELVWQGRSPG